MSSFAISSSCSLSARRTGERLFSTQSKSIQIIPCRPIKVSTPSLVVCQAKTKSKDKKKGSQPNRGGGKGFGAKEASTTASQPASTNSSPSRNFGEAAFPQLPEGLKLEETAEYFMFARKIKEGQEPGRWLPLGDITIQVDDCVKIDAAMKERRVLLREYAQVKYMSLKALKKGEDLEYGARVQRAPVETGEGQDDAVPGIQPMDVSGSVLFTIPAKLQFLSDLEWTMKDKKGMLNDAVERRRKEIGMTFEGKDIDAVESTASKESVVDQITNAVSKNKDFNKQAKQSEDGPSESSAPSTEAAEENDDGTVTFKF